MSVQAVRPKRASSRILRTALAVAALAVLVGAMIYDTKVVKIGSGEGTLPGVFSPAAFGASEFPKVQAAVDGRAVDAATLASALAKDQAAAVKQYGIGASAGPEFAVRFTGTVGNNDSGNYDVAVPGLPDTVHIRLQTGPAIMGTDLRDVTGTIGFGQFTNQIEYQNAGSALNKEMKKQVLAKVDPANLAGKTVSVVGAFQMTDPNNWLVTPAKLDVK